MSAHSSARIFPLLLFTLLLTACIRSDPDIIKIGLAAPFEGRYREIGVDVIPAVRLATSEWASFYAETGIEFEIVAYDDKGDPRQATKVARRIAIDPDVAIAIGHWKDDTTIAALPIYGDAGLPLITFSPAEIRSNSPTYNLSPSTQELRDTGERWQSMQPFPVKVATEQSYILMAATEMRQLEGNSTSAYLGGPIAGMSQFYALISPYGNSAFFLSGNSLPQDSISLADPYEFIVHYEERSLGQPPGIFANSAYQATWLAMSLIAESRGISITSPVDMPQFDAMGRIINSPLYLYRWEEGDRRIVEIFKTTH